jgi:tetratricopeptide (TPR) repeat protein
MDRQAQAQIQKDEGNREFKSGNYKQAIYCYSKAIELDPQNHLLYGNRAQTFINLKMPLEAEADCNQALEIEPNFVKGYFRRGSIRKQCQRWSEAMSDFRQVLSREPGNRMAQQEVQQLEEVLQRLDPKARKTGQSQGQEKAKEVPLKVSDMLETPLVPVKVPTQPPESGYQFELDWRELVGHDRDQLRVQYMEMMGTQTLAKIFHHSMEPSLFSDIIKALICSKRTEFQFEVLFTLTRMDRFDFIFLFLDEAEKQSECPFDLTSISTF